MDNIILVPGKCLSTLSLRRATFTISRCLFGAAYFYPRSPCGERRQNRHRRNRQEDFYPRSPCGERLTPPSIACALCAFLSTLSLRRATLAGVNELLEQSSFLSTLSLRRATAKVHKTVGHFCAYETNFMGIASSC